MTIDGSTKARDGFPGDSFASIQKYRDIDAWITQRSNLPIWWAEWSSLPAPSDQISRHMESEYQNAIMTATLAAMAPTASVALRWGPEENPKPPYTNGGQDAVWSSTRLPDGGRPLPFAVSMQQFERCFPPGQSLLATQVSSPDVLALASPTCVLLVNKTAASIDAVTDVRTTSLGPYAVAYVSRR